MTLAALASTTPIGISPFWNAVGVTVATVGLAAAFVASPLFGKTLELVSRLFSAARRHAVLTSLLLPLVAVCIVHGGNKGGTTIEGMVLNAVASQNEVTFDWEFKDDFYPEPDDIVKIYRDNNVLVGECPALDMHYVWNQFTVDETHTYMLFIEGKSARFSMTVKVNGKVTERVER